MTDTTTLLPISQAIRQGNDPRYFQAQEANNQLCADPSRRIAVTYKSEGLTIAAHLYRPPSVRDDEHTPGIVMPGPISSVKEETVPHCPTMRNGYPTQATQCLHLILAHMARAKVHQGRTTIRIA